MGCGSPFAFSGYFSVRLYAGHLGVVMTQAWLPAMLWAFNRALRRERLAGAALGGLVVALSLLAGHTASFLYVGLVLGAYAMYRAWKAWSGRYELRAALVPLLADRGQIDGRATAYVCRNYACNLPVTDPDALAEQLTQG